MKKAISFLLSAIICLMVFTMSTPVAFAASYNGTCGDGIQWSLNTSAGTLTISGNGEMNNYSLTATPGWDRYQGYIKSVIFEDGVTNVGAYAFYNGGNGYKYKKLTDVDLGSVETIGNYAFRGCAALSTFTNCESVKSTGSYSFLSCASVTEFPFDRIVEIGSGSFSGTALTDITLPETVGTIRAAAFEGCKDAQTITVPALINRLENRAFADCTNVSYINYNATSILSIGNGVFNGTGAENGLTLDIDDGVVTIPAGLFSSCAKLNNIVNGNSVRAINDKAFAHTAITGFNVKASVLDISGSAFDDCQLLTAFTVESGNENYSANDMGILLTADGSELVRYPCGRSATAYSVPASIITILPGAFNGAQYLESFTAGSSISIIPENCFADCPKLSRVTLASTVLTIDNLAFTNCDSLTSVSMPGVRQINNYAFSQCGSLSSFTATSKLTTIGDYVFVNCLALTSVDLSAAVTKIGKYVFNNCKSLASIKLLPTLREISEGTFSGCSSITSFTIPSGVKTIGAYAFASCLGLKSIIIPSTVTSIGKYAFGFEQSSGASVKPITGFKVYCASGSAAATYAQTYSVSYEFTTNSADDGVIPVDNTEETPVNEIDTAFSVDSIIDFILNFNFIDFLKQVVGFIVKIIGG
ncbi:MAG: leucine-rich repeat domain-containing protein [Clostridia bacterium]|nr:leucine-rich repeat domain-containing protein [Clostridia bacterium]